jgi:hypothetical protein
LRLFWSYADMEKVGTRCNFQSLWSVIWHESCQYRGNSSPISSNFSPSIFPDIFYLYYLILNRWGPFPLGRNTSAGADGQIPRHSHGKSMKLLPKWDRKWIITECRSR